MTLPVPEWLGVTAPLTIMAVGGILAMVLLGPGRMDRGRGAAAVGLVVIAGSATAILFLLPYIYWQQLPMGGLFVYDRFARYFQVMFLVLGLLLCLQAGFSGREVGRGGLSPVSVMLLLVQCAALTWLAASADLVALGMSIELVMVTFWGLAAAGAKGTGGGTSSAGLLRVWAVSSLLMFFGAALLFGIAGSTDLWEISEKGRELFSVRPAVEGVSVPWEGISFGLSLAFFTAGLLLMMESLPFAPWTSMVYGTAPLAFLGFLATGAKAAALAALMRMMWILFLRFSPPLPAKTLFVTVIGILSIATMIAGAWMSTRARSLRSLMAGSGISHCGILLAALAVWSREGIEVVMIYLTMYCAAVFGIFLVADKAIADRRLWAAAVSSDATFLEGLGRRTPALGGAAAVFLLALAGLPPTGGFTARLQILKVLATGESVWLKVLAATIIVATLFSFYYYGKVFISLWRQERGGWSPRQAPRFGVADVAALLLALALLVGGVYSEPLNLAVVDAMMVQEFEY